MKKIVVAAALMAAVVAGGAHAQVSALGWVWNLSGSCWQGTNANGAPIDRQCFTEQYNRFLRGSVTRADGFSGATVLGYDANRHRLEMYAWSNQNEPAVYTPAYDGASLSFAEVGGRVIWRRIDTDNFEIARQTRDGAAWRDARVIRYHRDGNAPAAFEATGANNVTGSGGFGWLDREAGHCVHQVEPEEALQNRGCLSWEYPHVMRQTWYWGSRAASGEMVLFKHGADMRFFYWDAQGNFGMGGANWLNNDLYQIKDADPNRRTALHRTGNGYISTTDTRDTHVVGRPWARDHVIRFKHD